MKTIILSLVIITNIYATDNVGAYQWDTFIQKALDASFSIKQDDAQLRLEKGKISQSTLWKNPTLDMAFDDGLDNNIDYTYFEFSQKLPVLGESSSKKRAAEFSLESAKHSKDSTILQVQYQAASLFQKIYFLKMQLGILDQQIAKIKDLQNKSKSREDLGEISNLERSRIDILNHQILMKKQKLNNQYIQVQFDAQALLNVDEEIVLQGDIVKPSEDKIDAFIASLEQSPEYLSNKAKLKATKEELTLIKTTRYALPELYLYSERDYNLNNKVDAVYGFGFRLSLPLWDRKDSSIEIQNSKIQKSTLQAQEVHYKMKRHLTSYHKLYTNASLQLEEYKKNLLNPSKKYYETTLFSFELGEKSLLELLDAQALFLQSQLEYQELISTTHFYWLQLSNAASINLLKDN